MVEKRSNNILVGQARMNEKRRGGFSSKLDLRGPLGNPNVVYAYVLKYTHWFQPMPFLRGCYSTSMRARPLVTACENVKLQQHIRLFPH